VFKHRIHEQVGMKTWFDWFSLAFLAGMVNTGGYLACHRFVTHVTGFATLAGVDAASGEWQNALGILTVPVYFLFGVMVSAYLVDYRTHIGKKPLYVVVMSAVSLLLLTAAVGGELGWFGTFGSELDLSKAYIFLALLCGASGLQNAALTSASGATIRTTHLTGITTDLGIGLIRASSLPSGDKRKAQEMKANAFRLGTVVFFMMGSGVGAVLFLRMHFSGFYVPAAIAAYATLIAYLDDRRASAASIV
jgi:uncharacterized membrane protein YoaK (UPF0700 family)